MARAGSEHVVPRGSTALAMRFVACAICLVAPAEASGPLSAVGFQWRETEGSRRHLSSAKACGKYSVCTGQVFESDVLTVANGPKCAFDEVLGLWKCGDILIMDEAFNALQTGTCTSDCTFLDEAEGEEFAALPYYWQIGDWGLCSALCGGGLQQRTVQCRDAVDYRRAPDANCDTEKPEIIRACNQSLRFTPEKSGIQPCSKACGGGWQEQPSLCALKDGYLGTSSLCPSIDAAALFPCATEPCPPVRWELGEWSECSKSCGGGVMTRAARCLGRNNTEVDIRECGGSQPSERNCNTQPCSPGAWYVSPWSPECVESPGSCGQGTQTRLREWPECLDAEGDYNSFDNRCETPSAAGSTACYTAVPCPTCEFNCHGRGTCQDGRCVCERDWRGQYCEIPQQGCPKGLLDGDGACCEDGVVDASGKCCESPSATLDRRGRCCLSGQLDAFGECDGGANYVDVGGWKCSQIPDAAGTCCKNGVVDECGVCNGYGASCALNVVANMLRASSDGPTHLPDFIFQNFMAQIVRVEPQQVTVQSTEQFTRTTVAGPEEGFRVQVQVSPKPGGSAGKPVPTTGEASLRLKLSEGSASPMGTVFLSQTLGISRSPVCGNGVCEIGERPLRDSTGGSSTACERDCGHPYVPCPIARGIEGEMTCGGRGVCFTASGQCGCYLGHRGGACEECIPGWVMTSRGCMFQSQTFGTQSGGTLTASLSSILIAVGVGAGVSFFMIVGFTLLTRRGLRCIQVEKAETVDARGSSVAQQSAASGDESCFHASVPHSPAASSMRAHIAVTSARALDSIVHKSPLGADSLSRFNKESHGSNRNIGASMSAPDRGNFSQLQGRIKGAPSGSMHVAESPCGEVPSGNSRGKSPLGLSDQDISDGASTSHSPSSAPLGSTVELAGLQERDHEQSAEETKALSRELVGLPARGALPSLRVSDLRRKMHGHIVQSTGTGKPPQVSGAAWEQRDQDPAGDGRW